MGAAKIIETENIEINDRYEEYKDLLVRRDQLEREAGSYQTAYTKEFGDMLVANFKMKIECIKQKKTISYCRRRMNRGLSINPARMNEEIEKEMKLYDEQLKIMMLDAETAKKSESVSEFCYSRAKKIYRRLAKLIHPDINKKTAQDEKLKELWARIVNAYNLYDVDELDDLEVLVRNALEELGDAGFEFDYKGIEEKIERVERRINDILSTEPYTYGALLADEEKKAEHRQRLQDEHDDYANYLETLKKTLEAMLIESGVKFEWKMS